LDNLKISLARRYTLYSLLLVTPAGFLLKFYSGPGHSWFNNYGAGLLYEIFWILFVFLFFPRKELKNKIPIWVFLITCGLELLQLWHPWFLEKVRTYFIGKALIGTTFVWWDFPHYALGCLIGGIWIRLIIEYSSDS
jgi:hypothetical protein